jgi:hypothetical protein
VEALSYLYQAIAADPSLAEAAGRLNTLTSRITGGDIGANVRNDIQARRAWLAMLKECAAFYRVHMPFDIVYTPLLTQVGTTDYGKATADFQTTAELLPAEVVFKVLNDLLSGLAATGNRGKWGFAGWPLLSIEPADRDAVVFGGERSFRFDVEAALIDATGRTIGTDRFSLTSGRLAFSSGDRRIALPAPARSTITFRQVSVLNYTPPLSIRITRVNSNAAEAAVESGYMRILTQAEYETLPEVIAQRQRGR